MLLPRLVATSAFLLASLGSASVGAFTLELTPTEALVEPSDVVVLDLVASGLGSDVLGDYDVDISFDPSLISLTSFVLTGALGDFGLGEALDFSLGEGPPGLLNLAVVSLLQSTTLGALQGPSFTLATIELTVDAISPGAVTLVALAVNAVGDGNGDPLPIDALGSTTLRRLPEPGTFALLLAGLAAVGVRRAANAPLSDGLAVWRGRRTVTSASSDRRA